MSLFKDKNPNCPNGHGSMPLTRKINTVRFRGVDISYKKECHTCPECGLEAGTVEQAGDVQNAIRAEYQRIISSRPKCTASKAYA